MCVGKEEADKFSWRGGDVLTDLRGVVKRGGVQRVEHQSGLGYTLDTLHSNPTPSFTTEQKTLLVNHTSNTYLYQNNSVF